MRSFIKPSKHQTMPTSFTMTLRHSKNGRNTGEWNLTRQNVIAFPFTRLRKPPPIHTHFIRPLSKNYHQQHRSHSVYKALMVRTRHIVSKANRALGMIRRNINVAPMQAKSQPYQALVRPHIGYCSSVWHPHTQTDVIRIEAV